MVQPSHLRTVSVAIAGVLMIMLLAPALYSAPLPLLPASLPTVLSTEAQQQIPGETVAARNAAQVQLDALSEAKRLFEAIKPLTTADFRAVYAANYALVQSMQEQCNAADEAFKLGAHLSYDTFLFEQNHRIHALIAIAAAQLFYEELYEKQMAVIFERLRRYRGFSGQSVEQEFQSILSRSFVSGGSILDVFCSQVGGIYCPSQPTSVFERARDGGARQVELIFDRSPSLYELDSFGFDLIKTGDRFGRAQRFADALHRQLEGPVVTNWFIEPMLNVPVHIPSAGGSRGQPQVVAQQARINIEPTDYFAIDRADQAKQQWLDAARVQFSQRQSISRFMLVPEGEYYVYRRDPRNPNQAIPANVKPNWIVNYSAGNPVIGYRFQMPASGSGPVVVDTIYEHFTLADFLKPDFKILRFEAGFNSESGLEGSAEVRFFHNLHRNFALQTQVEAVFRRHHDTVDLGDLPLFVERELRELDDFSTREFQLDFGPVFRVGNIQVAAMESLRWINRSGWDRTGLVGQYFFNVGYLFGRGQIGGYITSANKDEAVVRRARFNEVFVEETFLKVSDQVGVNFNLSLFQTGDCRPAQPPSPAGPVTLVAAPAGEQPAAERRRPCRDYWVEGAFGYLDLARRDSAPGGVVRFHLPPFWQNRLAVTAEFGYNESFVSPEDTWRLGFGVRLGEWGNSSSPRTFRESAGPAPVFVPRVRYETLTRIVRDGNRPPVAVAGPDMLNLEPFTRVVLDGTDSFDPDGDPIVAFEWTLLDDCASDVVLEDGDSAVASFVIGNGQTCSAQLVVTDALGAVSAPDVKLVTSQRVEVPAILSFAATPPEIRRGESSRLDWEVRPSFPVCPSDPNQPRVECLTIDITNVPQSDLSVPPLPSGNATVTPDDTTTYVLTVCNVVDECATAQATVLVRPNLPVIVRFTATPSEARKTDPPLAPCNSGEARSLLEWETQNATTVILTNPSGPVPPVGEQVVCLSQTTTFTLTATNDRGEVVTAEATVTVLDALPELISFTATPAMIRVGETSTLSWEVRNVDSVLITNLPGIHLPVDSVQVMPQQTTTYTLTATNDSGESVTAEVTLVVKPPLPVIEQFTADPPILRIGSEPMKSTLEWMVLNSVSVTITNLGPQPPIGSEQVMPSETTVYTLTATNAAGEIVTADVTVEVKPPLPRIILFEADPAQVGVNDPTTLRWQTVDAVDVTLTNGNNPPNKVDNSGEMVFNLVETTTFTLNAANGIGEIVTATLTVDVGLVPRIIFFRGPDRSVPNGSTVTLEWKTENAIAVVLESDLDDPLPPGPLPLSGSVQVTVSVDSNMEQPIFRLIAVGARGETVTGTVEVKVF